MVFIAPRAIILSKLGQASLLSIHGIMCQIEIGALVNTNSQIELGHRTLIDYHVISDNVESLAKSAIESDVEA